ncbi:hypothetical protein COEREDRAFT_12020 [Coemansia reversa NRRL 1564]|uniref:Uncharacterized protein n=1 Tax=Coemansia reversa (strain ATCC 12441 / NRRL 1564) TaxID=763665 RepID=A0A2G5B2E8_COERN|nr:hypothetical protein COEREDRAFT_12020 [Coemansia reversa NRRL 1564]|eukprot:PIA12887.1 hypothetical protein COEREDRAFT_12020 [Coemansia reversa NRRL 1564]
MGSPDQPEASTSKGKESEDVPMAGNLSKYSLDVPNATTGQIIAPKTSKLLEAFKLNIGEYSGNAKKDSQSCATLVTKIMSWRRGALIGVFEQLVMVTIQSLLHGDAKEAFAGEMFMTLESLLSALQIVFSLIIYQQHLLELIRSGEAFRDISQYNFGWIIKQYIDDCQELPIGLTMIADALQRMFPAEWKIINQRTATITIDELTAAVVKLEEMFLVDPEMTPKPFGSMVKPKVTPCTLINVKVEKPMDKSGNILPPMPVSEPVPLMTPKPGKTACKTAKARKLQAEVLDLKTQLASMTQAANVPLPSGNTPNPKGPAKPGKADPGAAVSLIQLKTAQQLELNVSTNRRPLLCSPWNEEPYRTIGTTNARISIENGLKCWVTLVVVDCVQPWDLLLGSAHLKLLHIQLMTPAMVKQLKRRGRPILNEGHTVNIDRDLTPDNNITDPQIPELVMPTDQDYAEISETMMDIGTIPNSDQGNNFFEYDNLYLSVSRANIKARIKHQLTNSKDKDKLINMLMVMGASTLCEYPSGCPPPAAIKLIKPPMQDGAQLMFTVQYPISEIAQKACEEFVELRIKYGIDEPTKAYA